MPIGHNFFFFFENVLFFSDMNLSIFVILQPTYKTSKSTKNTSFFLFLITMTPNNSQELLEENDIKVVVKNKTHNNEAAISSKMIYIQIEN